MIIYTMIRPLLVIPEALHTPRAVVPIPVETRMELQPSSSAARHDVKRSQDA